MALPLELQVAILEYTDPDTFISLLFDPHFRTVIQEHLTTQILPSIIFSSLKGQLLLDVISYYDISVETIYNLRYPHWKSNWDLVNRDFKGATHALASIDDEFLTEKLLSSFTNPHNVLLSYLGYFYLNLASNFSSYDEHIQKIQDNFEQHRETHLFFVRGLISRISFAWSNCMMELRTLTPPPIYHLLRSLYPTFDKQRIINNLREKYPWSRYNSEYEVIIEELKKA